MELSLSRHRSPFLIAFGANAPAQTLQIPRTIALWQPQSEQWHPPLTAWCLLGGRGYCYHISIGSGKAEQGAHKLLLAGISCSRKSKGLARNEPRNGFGEENEEAPRNWQPVAKRTPQRCRQPYELLTRQLPPSPPFSPLPLFEFSIAIHFRRKTSQGNICGKSLK